MNMVLSGQAPDGPATFGVIAADTLVQFHLALLFAGVMGLLGLLSGFVSSGVSGDLLRVVFFGVALVLVIIAAAARRRAR